MALSVLAICGSTRMQSTNHLLINAIASLYANTLEIQVFTGLAALPHFNPDIEDEHIETVQSFRQLLSKADGVLICTPEYAHGVPGALKNAIDWTVGSNEFYHKPTALITASTEGNYGHAALLETLKAINTK